MNTQEQPTEPTIAERKAGKIQEWKTQNGNPFTLEDISDVKVPVLGDGFDRPEYPSAEPNQPPSTIII